MKSARFAFLLLWFITFAVVLSSSGATGVPVWVRQYDGLFDGNRDIRGMVVSSNGTSYVTGNEPNSGYPDFVTVAYSSDGAPLWTNHFNGPDNHYDVPRAIDQDSSGNVYIAGDSQTLNQNSDWITIAYSNSGVALWTNRFAGPDSDEPNALAADHSGHVYVAGTSFVGVSLSDFVTVAYSSNGASLWVRRYHGDVFNGANAIAVDDNDNVYAGGETSGAGVDIAVLAYSNNGVPLWTNRYNGPGNGEDGVIAMTTDHNGHVYVVGQSAGAGSDYDYVVLAYSAAGTPLWTNRYNGPGNDVDYARAIKADDNGNVYVTGASVGVGSGLDWATIAYNSSGVSLWTNRYGGLGNGDDWAMSLALDGCGNVYVAGYSYDVDGHSDYTVIAYTGAGVPLWTNRYTRPGSYNDYALKMGIDANGSLYVSGIFGGSYNGPWGPLPGTDLATIKFNSSPNITAPPVSQTNLIGSTVTFAVSACGTRPLAYQWQKNGTNLVDGVNVSGATGNVLALSHAALSDIGSYAVIVSNTVASVTNSPVSLVIIDQPAFTSSSWSPTTGFHFALAGHSNVLYRIEASTNLVDWSPLANASSLDDTVLFTDSVATNLPLRFYRAWKIP